MAKSKVPSNRTRKARGDGEASTPNVRTLAALRELETFVSLADFLASPHSQTFGAP